MVRQPADRAFRRLNFELLVIFQEVMATGQARIAADNLGMTQSAVSHGLRRLSHIVGAQLFIRDRWILIPTPRASEIAPAVDRVVASVRTFVAPNEDEGI